MQIPNLTLAFAVLESRQFLESSVVRKIQELENSWLKIKLHSKHGQKDLIIAQQAFFFSDYPMPAKQLSSGFSAFLRKRLEGKKILSVKQHFFDRVVVFEFQDFFLILELFAKGNILLTDRQMLILGVLRTEHWKDRELKKGSFYKFPASKGKSPAEVSFEEFEKALRESDSEIVKEIIKILNIAPVFAEEALLEAKIGKTLPAKSLSKAQIKKLLEKIRDFYSPKMSLLKPVIAEKGAEKTALPFELKSAKKIAGFDSLNALFEDFFSKEFLGKEQRTIDADFQKRLSELQKNLESQLEAKQKLEEKILLNRKKGEAIFSHYPQLRQAFDALLEAKAQKLKEKEVMYKLSSFGFVKGIDLKKGKLIVELE